MNLSRNFVKATELKLFADCLPSSMTTDQNNPFQMVFQMPLRQIMQIIR